MSIRQCLLEFERDKCPNLVHPLAVVTCAVHSYQMCQDVEPARHHLCASGKRKYIVNGQDVKRKKKTVERNATLT